MTKKEINKKKEKESQMNKIPQAACFLLMAGIIMGFIFSSDFIIKGDALRDTIKPTCKTTGGSNTWYNTNRTIKITCSDTGGSGIALCGSIKTTPSIQKFSSTTDTTHYYNVKDKAGNTSVCSARVKIDKIAPTCTTSGGSNTWYNTNRTIKITCSDTGGSGVATCNGSNSSSSTVTYSSNINKIYSYIVRDAAGNSNTCYASLKIDKTAPNSPTWNANGSYYDAHCGSDSSSGTPTHCLVVCANSAGYGTCTPSTTTSTSWGCDSNSDCCAQTIDNVGNKSARTCHLHL